MFSRRELLKFVSAFSATTLASTAGAQTIGEKAKVYWTPELSSQALRDMYALINRSITGKVALKLHTGEPHGPNILPRDWIKDFQASIPQSTIVECNVLYSSPRQHTKTHREVLKTNGWTFSPVDIMDEDGDLVLPVRNGFSIKEFNVGKHLGNYDSMVVLTHFKGHTMGGFGGSLKNIAIGCGSGKVGKKQLHGLIQEGAWTGGPIFMERMVDGGSAIKDHFGKKIVYLNVMRRMSVDCDCAGTSAAAPEIPDLGILASTDLLAIDKACVDLIYALPEIMKKPMVERIESRSGLRQLTGMAEHGLGNPNYELIKVLNGKIVS